MTVETPSPSHAVRRHEKPSPLVVVAALIATMCIGAGLAIAVLFAPHGRDTTLLSGFIVSIIGPTVVGLLALLRSDHASQVGTSNATKLTAATAQLEAVAKDVNGHLSRHDDLARQLGKTADSLATLATNATPVARAGTDRTRATDTDATDVRLTGKLHQAAPLNVEQT